MRGWNMHKHVCDDSEGDELEKELLHVVPKGDVKRVRKIVKLIDNVQIHALESCSLCPPKFDACTPLSLAIRYGHLEIVKILIKAGSDKDWYLGFDDTEGDEYYGLEYPAFDALYMRRLGLGCKSEGLKILLYLIDIGANVKNLHWHAIRFDDLEGFKILIGKKEKDETYGPTDILFDSHNKIFNSKDVEDGDTFLIFAAKCGSVEIVKYLISRDADTKIRNKHGQTAYKVGIEGLKDAVKLHLNKGYDEVKTEEVEEYIQDNPKYGPNLQAHYEVVGFLEDVTPEEFQA